MDTRLDSRANTEQEMIVDIGVTLRRDCGSAYSRVFLEDVGIPELVIARVVSEGSVRENQYMYNDHWTSSLLLVHRRQEVALPAKGSYRPKLRKATSS